MRRVTASAWRVQVLVAAILLAGALWAADLSTAPGPQPAFAVGPVGQIPLLQATPSPTPSSIERFANPFGDPWVRKLPSNPEVPVSLTSGCHRVDPLRSNLSPSPDLMQFVARSSGRLVFEECAEVADISDGQGAVHLRPFTTALKAMDPSMKFIGYYAASVAPTGNLTNPPPVQDGEPLGLRYIDANREDWFVHQKGKPATRQYRLKHVSGDPVRLLFGEILDVTKPDLRQFLVTKLVQSMDFHAIDGVMIDGCNDLPQYTTLIQGNVPPDEVVANWAQGCVAFLDDLKRADPSKIVLTLNYWSLVGQGRSDHETFDYDWFVRRLAVSDGLLWEDPIGPVGYPPSEVQASLDRLSARIAYARSHDKYLGVFVNTNVGGQSTFRTTTSEQEHAFARYYLAAYLTVAEGLRTLFIPYTPVGSSDQFHSAAYFSVWDLDVGRPTGPRQMLSQGVYRRDFERARVFLNGSTGPLNVSLDDARFMTSDGVPVRSATVPAKSGAIFLKVVSPPACSPRPPVRITTRGLDAGAVEVRIAAGLGDVRRIEVGRATNALISVQGGPQQVAGDRAIDLPLGSTSTIMTLRRASPNAGVFAQFSVVDSCGTWKTFAGRGATP
jgi:hypothetical protein